ncbi:MAG TPA: cellulose synthase subunit BcsC-related outer membrane protein [Vicinamibacteria bacterium]|nr:cellulose synthase subunit BcsC-related outer membrane protein [Vicinamibacteria bacterium]
MRRACGSTLLLMALSPGAYAQPSPAKPEAQEPPPVSSEEIERLRRELERETRSSFELLLDGHTESGGLNDKLSFLRFGGRLNLRRGEHTTLRLTARHTPYTTEDGVVEESGTSLTLGALTRSERVEYEWEVGATRFSTDRWDGTGLLRVSVHPSEKLRYFVGASRQLVEESMLSAVGLEPVLGPFAGERVGAVTDNRLALGGSYQLPMRLDLVGEAAVGVYSGSNVGSNFFTRLGGGPAWNAVARAPDEPLSLLRVGAWFEYFGFDEDRLGYGGASLVDAEGQPVPPSELGSDGIPPDPDPPDQPGVGGYFSPERFTSVVGRVDVRGRTSGGHDYGVTAFLGTQSYTGADRSGAFGVTAHFTLHLGERASLPVSYEWNNYGPFDQQMLKARLVLLF